MVLLNLEALSDKELLGILQTVGEEIPENYNRYDLIELLEDYYDDHGCDIVTANDIRSTQSRKRYINRLFDVESDETRVTSLPGVDPVPSVYSDTSIHLVMKDPQWVYCYWSFSNHFKAMHTNEDEVFTCKLFLRIYIESASGEKTSYDINITEKDSEWNISLPGYGSLVRVALGFYEDGTEDFIAVSDTLSIAKPYWIDHMDTLSTDIREYEIAMSSIIGFDGMYRDNPVTEEFVSKICQGVITNE